MPTFQALSAPRDIDHLKITGEKDLSPLIRGEVVSKHYGLDRGSPLFSTSYVGPFTVKAAAEAVCAAVSKEYADKGGIIRVWTPE